MQKLYRNAQVHEGLHVRKCKHVTWLLESFCSLLHIKLVRPEKNKNAYHLQLSHKVIKRNCELPASYLHKLLELKARQNLLATFCSNPKL